VSYERLFVPFVISPGVVLPAAEYRFTRWRSNIETARQRSLQVSLGWTTGSYWSGRANEVTASVTYRLPPRFAVTLDSNQTFATLPEGNFIARIFSTQMSYSVSPFIGVSSVVQFDNLSRALGWQGRFRWIQRPGNDVFLVFNQGWTQDELGGLRFSSQDRKVSAKVQYAIRL
jgi:hypothetical protein